VPAVEPLGVGGVEPVHGLAQVGPASAEEEVVVVGHEAEGKKLEREAGDGLAEEFEEGLTVGVIQEDVSPVVTPAAEVIDRAGELNAPGSGHAHTIPGRQQTVKGLIDY
jgi:hypothetical protein